MLGPGNFSANGIVKKPFVHWVGSGKVVTAVSAVGSIDLTHPSMFTDPSLMEFSNLAFLNDIVADMFTIGGTGWGSFYFRNCEFTEAQNFTGRGTSDFVSYSDCVLDKTPCTWTSCFLQMWQCWTQDDGGDKLYIQSANSTAMSAFIMNCIIGSDIEIASDTASTVTMLATPVAGDLTVDGATSTLYKDSLEVAGTLASTNSGVILRGNTSGLTKNTSTVTGTTVDAALDWLKAKKDFDTGANGYQIKFGDIGYLSRYSSEVHAASQAELNGGTWTAKGTTASIIGLNAGGTGDFVFFADSGLTPETTYSPTQVALLKANGKLTLAGSLSSSGQILNRTTVALDYTVLPNDHIIGVTDTSMPRIITLPPAASVEAGRVYSIKDESGLAGTNNITVLPDGAELIDGAASYLVTTNYGSVSVYCDGANWMIYG